jgi:O-antigen/teichoic acid export membrane protein
MEKTGKFNNIINRFSQIKDLFSDKNLTKKASLNALASGTDYFAKLIVGFITTPLMVAGFGDYFFGVWQVMNRMFSYLSTTVGATSPLEWTLAKDQSSTDFDQKRSYVGSSIIIWGMFLPLIGIVGGLITWFAPTWLSTPPEYIWIVRTIAGLFILSEAFTALSFLPYAILRGQNQGYRRLGFSILLILLNGGLTWLALFLKTGIIGVTISSIIQLIFTGLFYFFFCKKYIPWFGIKRPSFSLVKHFLKLSGWFFASDVISNITFASDVVILGLLSSVESVTAYTLTKYIPETVISFIAIVVIGIIPGLGGIIGTGDFKRAGQVRGEVFSLTWLVVTVMGSCILLWNRYFLTLWVGSERYAGSFANLLIVFVVAQFVMIRTDASIIDLTLRVQRKVLLGALSVAVSIILGCIFVGVFNLGIVGVSIGLIVGRLILSISYPTIVSRFLNLSTDNLAKQIARPSLVMSLLFFIAFLIDKFIQPFKLSGITGWVFLIIGAGLTAVFSFMIALITGLSKIQRNSIISRFRMLISK